MKKDVKITKIAIFKGKKIRKTIHKNEWWFSVIDVIEALTGTQRSRKYWNDLKRKLTEEGYFQVSEKIGQLKLLAEDGKKYFTDCADTESIFRIIQSIPSPKAEPFKRWLARVGYERVKEIEDPELATKRTKMLYRAKGYPDTWIEKRMRGIAVREELTDEWKKRKIKEQREYEILTAEISKACFGMTPSQYKKFKKLKRGNLRDHMNDLELIFSMLGEASTTEIARNKDAQGFSENKSAAQKGGKIAGGARKKLEKETKKKISTKNNFLKGPKNNKFLIAVFFLLFCFNFWNSPVFASNTDGTIDSTYKYAWSENVGWLNFGCDNCNVRITDSGLSGYALSEAIGWLYLGDIINDGAGNLSGYAWCENTGWINFAPTNGGVIINSSGEFIGSALSETIGWIIFDGDYVVKTDWRPQNNRPACNNAIDDDSDGKIDYPNDPGCESLDDTDETDIFGTVFIPSLVSQPSAPAPTPALELEPELEPEKIIKIIPEIIEIPEIIQQIPEIIKQIPEVIKQIPEKIIEIIPEFLKPEPEEIELEPITPKEIPIEELVPEKAPLAMQHSVDLLSQEIIEKFVLEPLPKEIRELAKKFPKLGETLKKVGITKISDIEKFKNVKLTLPGLTESLGLSTIKVVSKGFALPQGVPVAELSSRMKQELPAEIVFAKTAGELIDFNIALTINEKGEPQQKIATIVGKPLQLVVKPEYPVKSIKGYIVFKTKKISQSLFPFSFNNLTASLIFANPVFAHMQDKPVRVEEKLVLLEFEYTDPDGDGIYTAEIQTPLVEGEYEIITVMEFEDPELGKKEIRLITVVDPEGYIYEKDGNKETRIPGAIVSIYWLNPGTKQYESWLAKEYQQENPQITNATGKYSFLVPEGSYYLKVETPGYLAYDGKPFEVKEGRGVHINIELKTKYWWLDIVDWKTLLLIVVILFLMYNFYRDRIRERILKHKT